MKRLTPQREARIRERAFSDGDMLKLLDEIGHLRTDIAAREAYCETLRHEYAAKYRQSREEFERQQLAAKDDRIVELEKELKTVKDEVACAGCGMVYPGKPSFEPWSCDKCLDWRE